MAFHPAGAQDGRAGALKLDGDVRYQFENEDNLDLGTGGNDGGLTHALDSRIRATWVPVDDLTLFAEGRGYRNFSDIGSTQDEETGAINTNDAFVELRQAWVQMDDPFGLINWNVQLGRQRLSEPYNFWWNRDLDLARVNFDYTLLKGFVAAGEDTVSYRSGPQAFLEDDKDRARVMAQASFQWTGGHYVEGRFLHEQDYSGLENIGSVIDTDKLDSEDAKLSWLGVRFRGDVISLLDLPFHYRVDAVGVTGSVEGLTTASAGVGRRSVTGHTDTDVRGYAFDAEGVFETALPGRPSFLFGYAFGSGDDDSSDGTDHAFRQSGLHGNSSRAATMEHLRYQYGDVLNPDLSNLHILSAGVILPVLSASDTSLTYRYYQLVDAEGAVTGDQIDADLDGHSNHLGQALDLTVNFRLGDELHLTGPLLGTSVRVTAGAFRAGDAYVSSAEDETAMRGFVEFKLSF